MSAGRSRSAFDFYNDHGECENCLVSGWPFQRLFHTVTLGVDFS
jgi:hypothetical protein